MRMADSQQAEDRIITALRERIDALHKENALLSSATDVNVSLTENRSSLAAYTATRIINLSQDRVDSVVQDFANHKHFWNSVMPGWFSEVSVSDSNNVGSKRALTYAAKRLNGGGKRRQETLVAKDEHSHTISVDYGAFTAEEENLGLMPIPCRDQTRTLMTAAISSEKTLLTVWGQATVNDPMAAIAFRAGMNCAFASLCDLAEANLGTLDPKVAAKRTVENMSKAAGLIEAALAEGAAAAAPAQ